jgi:uncharacterized protein (DUF849 family)
MAQQSNKVIITCAITGSIHTPTMSAALPVTPDEIATQAIDAAKAGAATPTTAARHRIRRSSGSSCRASSRPATA